MTERPWTLRDVRRAAAKYEPRYRSGYAWRHGNNWYPLTCRQIDALIAEHGASALAVDVIARPRSSERAGGSPAAEESVGALDHSAFSNVRDLKKPTKPSERTDPNDRDADCLSTVSGPGQAGAEEDEQSRPSDRACPEREDPQPGTTATTAGPPEGGYPKGSGDPVAAMEPSDPTGREVTAGAESQRPSADTLERDARGGASADDSSLGPLDAHESGDGGPVTSLHRDRDSRVFDSETPYCGAISFLPSRSYGGDFGMDWASIETLARHERGAAVEIERALRALVRSMDTAGIEACPRLSGRRLAVELVSRRYALSRATRRDSALPLIVLAADVSGSCSAVCASTLVAAVAVARSLPTALVVRHSNGRVIDVIGAPATRLSEPGVEPRLSDLILSGNAPLGAVVAWGDWDAGDDYRSLCERATRLYWLDSYAACSGARPASSNLREGAIGWSRQPAGWWQGVNDAARAAIALRAMSRSTARDA